MQVKNSAELLNVSCLALNAGLRIVERMVSTKVNEIPSGAFKNSLAKSASDALSNLSRTSISSSMHSRDAMMDDLDVGGQAATMTADSDHFDGQPSLVGSTSPVGSHSSLYATGVQLDVI